MSKKLYAALLPVLAVVAFASMSAAAQAAPHWYVKGVRLPFTGAKTAVTTKGTLTLHALGGEITCKVKDAGSIWNPKTEGAGEDEITEFVNSECVAVPAELCPKPVEIIAVPASLPWKSLLKEVAGVIRDEIKGIEIELRCGGAKAETFAGSLSPKIVDGSPTVAEFDSGSGSLTGTGASHPTATATGTDAIEHGTEKVDAKNP